MSQPREPPRSGTGTVISRSLCRQPYEGKVVCKYCNGSDQRVAKQRLSKRVPTHKTEIMSQWTNVTARCQAVVSVPMDWQDSSHVPFVFYVVRAEPI
jgi:hypothetical protein